MQVRNSVRVDADWLHLKHDSMRVGLLDALVSFDERRPWPWKQTCLHLDIQILLCIFRIFGSPPFTC